MHMVKLQRFPQSGMGTLVDDGGGPIWGWPRALLAMIGKSWKSKASINSLGKLILSVDQQRHS
jgi:hypothetical protein